MQSIGVWMLLLVRRSSQSRCQHVEGVCKDDSKGTRDGIERDMSILVCGCTCEKEVFFNRLVSRRVMDKYRVYHRSPYSLSKASKLFNSSPFKKVEFNSFVRDEACAVLGMSPGSYHPLVIPHPCSIEFKYHKPSLPFTMQDVMREIRLRMHREEPFRVIKEASRHHVPGTVSVVMDWVFEGEFLFGSQTDTRPVTVRVHSNRCVGEGVCNSSSMPEDSFLDRYLTDIVLVPFESLPLKTVATKWFSSMIREYGYEDKTKQHFPC